MKARAPAAIARPATPPRTPSRTYLAGTVYEALRRDIADRTGLAAIFVAGAVLLILTTALAPQGQVGGRTQQS